MLNVNINYPYPVIRPYTEDYKKTIFEGALSVNLQPDGYLICPNFVMTNLEIDNLISEGKLTYAIEVISPSTWYRKLFIVKDNAPIKLEPIYIHERVEIIPCIVAKEEIQNFVNMDFEDEYKGLVFNIKAGDIIAIGEAKVFDALYKNDVIKDGVPIVNIGGSDEIKEIICDYSGRFIEVTLPMEVYKNYLDCGSNPTKYDVLNSVLSIPPLVEAIRIIADDDNPLFPQKSRLESKAWYKTIMINLKRIAGNNDNKYRDLLSKPFVAAEMLMGNNYVNALKYIEELE